MKYLIVLVASLALAAADEEKKQTKRGLLDLGYGAHDAIYSEPALSLGHADFGSHFEYAPAPLLKSYAAPALTYAATAPIIKSAPVFSYPAYAESAPLYAKSYAAPTFSYAPAPIYTKSYAAPAVGYAAPAFVKSYAAAPVISKAVTYAAPAPVYAKSYGAPLSLGYSSPKYW